MNKVSLSDPPRRDKIESGTEEASMDPEMTNDKSPSAQGNPKLKFKQDPSRCEVGRCPFCHESNSHELIKAGSVFGYWRGGNIKQAHKAANAISAAVASRKPNAMVTLFILLIYALPFADGVQDGQLLQEFCWL